MSTHSLTVVPVKQQNSHALTVSPLNTTATTATTTNEVFQHVIIEDATHHRSYLFTLHDKDGKALCLTKAAWEPYKEELKKFLEAQTRIQEKVKVQFGDATKSIDTEEIMDSSGAHPPPLHADETNFTKEQSSLVTNLYTKAKTSSGIYLANAVPPAMKIFSVLDEKSTHAPAAKKPSTPLKDTPLPSDQIERHNLQAESLALVQTTIASLKGSDFSGELESKKTILTTQSLPQPKGIPNIKLTCWMNSLLQMILTSPHLKQKILEQAQAKNEAGLIFANFILRYHETDHTSFQNALETVLHWFNSHFPIDAQASLQQDPAEAFSILMGALKITSDFNFHEDSKPNETQLPIHLNFPPATTPPSPTANFTQMLETSIGNSGNNYFTSSLDSLFLHAVRFTFDKTTKQPSKIRIPFGGDLAQVFTIQVFCKTDEEQPAEQVSYDLTSFLVHKGEQATGGHYVSYVKINDKWYECDDSIIKETALTAIPAAAQNAVFFHYKKQEPGAAAAAAAVPAPAS